MAGVRTFGPCLRGVSDPDGRLHVPGLPACPPGDIRKGRLFRYESADHGALRHVSEVGFLLSFFVSPRSRCQGAVLAKWEVVYKHKERGQRTNTSAYHRKSPGICYPNTPESEGLRRDARVAVFSTIAGQRWELGGVDRVRPHLMDYTKSLSVDDR